jgi:hypothetical protein
MIPAGFPQLAHKIAPVMLKYDWSKLANHKKGESNFDWIPLLSFLKL